MVVSLMFALPTFMATWSASGRFWFAFSVAAGIAIGYPVVGLLLNLVYDLLRWWAFGDLRPQSYRLRSTLAMFWPLILIPYAAFLLVVGFVRLLDPDK